jgi:hypothetical protein
VTTGGWLLTDFPLSYSLPGRFKIN